MNETNAKVTIKTKMGQAPHLGKWEAAAQMVRLVRELAQRLEDEGLVTSEDHVACDNVIYSFLDEVPKKVFDEMREG